MFLSYCFNTHRIRRFIDLNKVSSAGQNTVSQTTLAQIAIPVPSPVEQCRILEEIEDRFSLADKAEEIIEQSLKQAARLRQSILKKAFEGKLVPQDPKDEPAEKLLERIKAEMAKVESERKPRKRLCKKATQ